MSPYHEEEHEVAGFTVKVKIYQDEDAPNPRKEFDHFGNMVCWHRDYDLGDDKPAEDPSDFYDGLPRGTEILPLYLYDHSGITMSTTGFSCPWDSGQVGYIYATPEMIRKEYGCKRITKQVRDKVRRLLKAEVEEYDQYLTGDVWGYVVTMEDEDGKEVDEDSCWGFFGYNYCLEEAQSVANHMKERAPALAVDSYAI